MSRQESSPQTTGAHRKHRAQGGRERVAREAGVPGADTAGEGARDAGRDSGVRDSARVGPDRERGAHAHGRERRPQGTLPMQPPAHYDPYLDGLFTYCLSILCEHDAAAAALGEALALAERQRARLRDPALRRPWLYALARWVCLRRLAVPPAAALPASEAVAEQRRAQLASLAWPEAAGTTPEQREALELAVRHQLSAREVAHVLGLEPEAARPLLAQAACEVERTRTALAVVDTGRCAAVAQLAGEARVLLGTALRAELVRHVDDCAVCRRTAERVVAAGPWPGAAGAADPVGPTAVLALIEAPRSAAYAALLYAMDAGFGRARHAVPRFDRHGFPLDLKDRAARRAQLRHRAVTSTVVAAVVAAPVLALWAAYQAAPLGEGHGTDRAASEPDGLDGVPFEKAGSSRPSARPPSSAGAPSAAGAPAATTVAVSSPSAAPPSDGSGYLRVTARAGEARTLVTLTASGGTPVRWEAATSAYWLRLSTRGGSLRPGESATLVITVDHLLEPAGSWSARISFAPGHATVTLSGTSARSVPPPVTSSPSPRPSPTPTAPPPSTPPPSPPATSPPGSPSPTPTPTPTDSTPPTGDPSPSPTPTPTAS
jgi:DNA-directed RNA polymerase specialized sigma24 family protein